MTLSKVKQFYNDYIKQGAPNRRKLLLSIAPDPTLNTIQVHGCCTTKKIVYFQGFCYPSKVASEWKIQVYVVILLIPCSNYRPRDGLKWCRDYRPRDGFKGCRDYRSWDGLKGCRDYRPRDGFKGCAQRLPAEGWVQGVQRLPAEGMGASGAEITGRGMGSSGAEITGRGMG